MDGSYRRHLPVLFFTEKKLKQNLKFFFKNNIFDAHYFCEFFRIIILRICGTLIIFFLNYPKFSKNECDTFVYSVDSFIRIIQVFVIVFQKTDLLGILWNM